MEDSEGVPQEEEMQIVEQRDQQTGLGDQTQRNSLGVPLHIENSIFRFLPGNDQTSQNA